MAKCYLATQMVMQYFLSVSKNQDMHTCTCLQETAEALHALRGCYACSIGYHLTTEWYADCPL